MFIIWQTCCTKARTIGALVCAAAAVRGDCVRASHRATWRHQHKTPRAARHASPQLRQPATQAPQLRQSLA